MNYKLLMDVALLAGEIMLTSGAETYRVEDTMCRILRISNLEKTEAFVTTTGIFATLDDISIDAITLVKRVSLRSTNLNQIYLVNNISRKLCNDEMELVTAYQELKEIKNKQLYPDYIIWITTITTSAFFSIVLGGDIKDGIISAINGMLIVLCMIISKRTNTSQFITNMVASVLIAINTMIYITVSGDYSANEVIIAGSIMPMVPGVAITNAVRDTLQGDYMSGATRAMEAFLIAASIAIGIGAGLSIFSYVVGGNPL